MIQLLEQILKEDQFEDLFQPTSKEELQKRVIEYIESVCTKNSDGTYSCEGNIYLSNRNLTELPVQFKEVKGEFRCSYNKLTSLEGSPEKVGGGFYCSYNKLTSLEGAPVEVGGNFFCSSNELTSLEGAPESVGGKFSYSPNPVSDEELKKTVDRDYLK